MSDSAFQEYPKMMVHPAYRQGVVDGDGTGRSAGQPVRFPPVMVNNEDQEAQHAAAGYIANGVSDIAAFNRMTQAKQSVPQAQHEVQEWPKWIEGVLYADEAQWRSETGQEPAETTPVQAELSADALAVKASFETGLADLQAQLAVALQEIERLKNPKPKPHSYPNRGRPRKAS